MHLPRVPVLPRRHRLLAAGALVSAVALGTVTASQAAATGGHRPPAPPKDAAPPIGYRPTDSAPDDVNEANDAFAACMREHGQDAFPSFHATKNADGGIGFTVKMSVKKGQASPDLSSDAFKKAFKKAFDACKGPLEDAGVSFPANGLPFPDGDLPAPPKHPGGHHKFPGPGLHVEHSAGAAEGLSSRSA
ncbi:hypothetical protein ACIBL6_45900 [Streptomyces sp. NPDC050400]|uniref:hypothetical protein n=1 Tax=Streptomyces sp. NPDC050400 TaxID=3365610 RepID=UPI0037A10235